MLKFNISELGVCVLHKQCRNPQAANPSQLAQELISKISAYMHVNHIYNMYMYMHCDIYTIIFCDSLDCHIHVVSQGLLPSVAGVKGRGEAGRSSMEESRGFSTSSSINRPPHTTAAEEGEEEVWLATQEGEGEGMEEGRLVEVEGLEGEGWIGGVARGSSIPSLCAGPERVASDGGSSPTEDTSMGLGSQAEGLALAGLSVSGHGAVSSVHSPVMLCVWSISSSPASPSFPTHSFPSSASPPPTSSLYCPS